jgi:hypothetical protein
MKYELETIPIWDAYNEDTECPLCFLADRAEARYLDFFLGSSVMAPETRIEVNKTGFCREHFTQLLESRKNRLGLGLMTQTYLSEEISRLSDSVQKIGNLAAGSKQYKQSVDEFISSLNEKQCMICDKINYTLKRYCFTIVYLWKKDVEFKNKFEQSKGFCLKHVPEIIIMAREALSNKLYAQFGETVFTLLKENTERLEQELLWYTQKSDYLNTDKPWGTSKDALHRTIQKLTGKTQRFS